MALNYNLKYKKLNFFYKALLEKEGEIIIERQSFRLKGKGAGDQGETIYFSDIRELIVGNNEIKFTTFRKERYILDSFSNLFESFLKDFFRVRNEYLAEALLMKVGMLYHEYDGQVEILNRFGKTMSRGMSRIQFYEGSILIIPETHDCFVVYLNFLKNHEFDEDEYVLKLSLDTGSSIHISKLGTTFEDVQETLESLLGKMYERVVNHLREIFPDLDPVTLLKFAYLIRDGKCVLLSALKKIHDDLPKKVEAFLFANSSSLLKEKVQMLRSMETAPDLYISFSITNKPDHRSLQIRSWFVVTLPQHNLIALGMTSNPADESIYFFRILSEAGDIEERLQEKILEINQSLFLTRFDVGPLYKDKREFRKTKYQTALRRLSFLRFLRKSFVGKSMSKDGATFRNECEKLFIPTAGVLARNKPVINKTFVSKEIGLQ